MASLTILVEDNETIRDNLIPALVDLGESIVIAFAETELEAIAAFKDHTDWQLAVVDLFLREGSGLGVLRACQRRSAGQRVIVLSNYMTPDIRRRCVALGADACFDKSTELEAFIDDCLAHSRK